MGRKPLPINPQLHPALPIGKQSENAAVAIQDRGPDARLLLLYGIGVIGKEPVNHQRAHRDKPRANDQDKQSGTDSAAMGFHEHISYPESRFQRSEIRRKPFFKQIIAFAQ